jgi:phosphoenolpyruvate synthase/pyruvate phosphate dikinase
VTGVVRLEDARDDSLFGSKAVGLGEATRAGLPLPPGVALSGAVVDAVAGGDEQAIEEVRKLVRPLGGPLAVRSSAVDEDGAEASFAGQHLTLLNVPSADDVSAALREVWWSANSDSAISYRQRVGLFTRPSVGVVVQTLLDPDSAGVMFTRNPITRADERVIEASWGLGEAVVAGRVIPDHFRVGRSGEVLERTPSRSSRFGRFPRAAQSRRRFPSNSPSSYASATTSSRSSTALQTDARRSTGRLATSSGLSPTGSSTSSNAERLPGPGRSSSKHEVRR